MFVFPKKSPLAILSLILFLSICGCGANYTASELEHTYITDTQSYHSSTGIKLSHDNGPGLHLLSFLTNETVEIFIDGRLAAKYPWDKDYEAFIQLPPGFHKIVVQAKTLQGGVQEAEFHLDEGQQQSFSTYCNSDGDLLVPYSDLKYLQRSADIQRKKSTSNQEKDYKSRSLEDRLSEIEDLFNEGLITEEEKNELRKKVILEY